MSGLSIVCRSLQHGENYVNWSEEVKCFLMGQECWIIYSGAEGEPEDVASKKLFSCCSVSRHCLLFAPPKSITNSPDPEIGCGPLGVAMGKPPSANQN